ncbi:hypothetical protein HK100_009013 [Physocladia obscura]|uniref:Uncharacterized protein n=1 Tax=Physocladia obscura TaxID=109957 RepID=A0AAD5XI68_9FUNG|nr:hypothetical protein HK100_009013 [Physocladia obscura]
MVHVTSRLNLTFQTFNPGFLGDFGMDGGRANQIIDDGLVRLICQTADVIIVADTIPVLEMTTRFDWYIGDQKEYFKLLWKLSLPEVKNMFWVANNPLEPLDLSFEALATPKFRILRPTGFSELNAQDVSESDQKLALCREDENSAIFAAMKQMKIPFKRGNHGYGGPKTLVKYKAFIEFPYQVSTMKLYENLAAGVVMLFPSKEFFKQLIQTGIHSFHPWDKISRAGDNWHMYMDYYHPDISPYSMLINDENLDTKNVRVNGPKAYAKLVTQTLHGWAQLFDEMGFPGIIVDNNSSTASGPDVDVYRAPLYKDGINAPTSEESWEQEFRALEAWRNTNRAKWIQDLWQVRNQEKTAA